MVAHHAVRALAGLALTALFSLHATGWLALPLVPTLEHLAYDARLKLTLVEGVDPRVVIVDIDELSLRQEGQWPWPRGRLADLVNQLFERYQIAALGFDVVFAEPDPSGATLDQLASGPWGAEQKTRAQLAQWRAEWDPDQRFAAALQNRPVILGYFFNTSDNPSAQVQTGQLPAPIASVSTLGAVSGGLIEAVGYGANLPALQAAALNGGFFNSPLVDTDGVFRRTPLLVRHQGGVYEQLALAVTRALLGQPPLQLMSGAGYGGMADRRLEALSFGGFTVPVDAQGAVLVPYRGRQGRFPYVPAREVLAGQADPQVLEQAIVLVGTTAAGLLDLRATPVQNVYPGVEINANLIIGLLDQRFKTRPSYSAGLEVLQLVLVGTLATLIGFLNPWRALLLLGGLAAGLLAVNAWLWQTYDLVAPLASPLVLLLLLYVLYTSYNFWVEARRERWLTKCFGQYVPHEIVAEMSRRGESYSLAGESRQMTVLFSDIVGFTALSEHLEPRQLTQMMQRYLTPMTRVIHEHHGTIDKYIGDAIMAFWGAPLADPDHARHALHAAFAMQRALQELNQEFQAQGWPPLRLRTGMNSGVMSVGNMGSEFRMSYTVLGDAVNLAARLESASRSYGVPIVVSEATRALMPEWTYRELDRVRVKGRAQAVTIYQPLGPATALSDAEQTALAAYNAALHAFQQQAWTVAETAFSDLLATQPDCVLYALYQQRAATLRHHPPPAEWDGVFTLESK